MEVKQRDISSDENEEQKETENQSSNDLAKWNSLSDEDRIYWIDKGPSDCQHWNDNFAKSKCIFKNRNRYCSKGIFQGEKANGEKFNREWLVYSPSTGYDFCFVCNIFSSSSGALVTHGFSDWKNTNLIQSHENSMEHRNSLLTYLTRKHSANLNSKLSEQTQIEKEYWKQLLQRCVEVIKTLSEHGLAFRGDNEIIGSPNSGNYLGLLELIAKFDLYLSNHIENYGNKGTGSTSYLSKTICNELILLMGKHVLQSILDEIKQAGYFSLSVDSTPDLSLVDQLTIILRYVSPQTGVPVGRFIRLLKLEEHTSLLMANWVFDYLVNECGIDFSKCRGQSYDNAANMSGKYNGM